MNRVRLTTLELMLKQLEEMCDYIDESFDLDESANTYLASVSDHIDEAIISLRKFISK